MERKKIGILLTIIGIVFIIITFIPVTGELADPFLYLWYYFVMMGFFYGGIILAIIGVILILKSRQKTGK